LKHFTVGDVLPFESNMRKTSSVLRLWSWKCTQIFWRNMLLLSQGYTLLEDEGSMFPWQPTKSQSEHSTIWKCDNLHK